MYKVKEIHYTIQGEGYHSGRPAVFCRFTGCNLWSGREEDRKNAICTFCDTDFWGTDGFNGGKYDLEDLSQKINSLFPSNQEKGKFVVFTGGEPALQVDEKLINALHDFDMELAIETNGTCHLPEGLDWICVSPKANTEIVLNKANELKIVIPQVGINPLDFDLSNYDHAYVQALESNQWEENTKYAIDFVHNHPEWKLSVQTHKYLNIP